MKKITKAQLKEFANEFYDKFEQEGFTLNQAARYVESKKEAAVGLHLMLNLLRNDISAHVSDPKSKLRLSEPFYRKKHTHKFANL